MDLLTLVLVLVAVALVLGVVTKYGPNIGLDGTVIWWLRVVIIAVTIIWLLNVFGVFDLVRRVPVPTAK